MLLVPPSSVDPFLPLMPPHQRGLFGPLSEKKTTTVSRDTPAVSIAARIRPTFLSRFSTIAKAARVKTGFSFLMSGPLCRRGRSANRLHSASGTHIGEWGVLNAT